MENSGCIDGCGRSRFVPPGAFGPALRGCRRIRQRLNTVSMLQEHMTGRTKPRFINSSLAPPLERLQLSLWCCACHRLMSRLASQDLLLAASPQPTLSKKGCLRASASSSRLEGSYSSMLSMRSNSWWCSSASDSKYRWRGNGWLK